MTKDDIELAIDTMRSSITLPGGYNDLFDKVTGAGDEADLHAIIEELMTADENGDRLYDVLKDYHNSLSTITAEGFSESTFNTRYAKMQELTVRIEALGLGVDVFATEVDTWLSTFKTGVIDQYATLVEAAALLADPDEKQSVENTLETLHNDHIEHLKEVYDFYYGIDDGNALAIETIVSSIGTMFADKYTEIDEALDEAKAEKVQADSNKADSFVNRSEQARDYIQDPGGTHRDILTQFIRAGKALENVKEKLDDNRYDIAALMDDPLLVAELQSLLDPSLDGIAKFSNEVTNGYTGTDWDLITNIGSLVQTVYDNMLPPSAWVTELQSLINDELYEEFDYTSAKTDLENKRDVLSGLVTLVTDSAFEDVDFYLQLLRSDLLDTLDALSNIWNDYQEALATSNEQKAQLTALQVAGRTAAFVALNTARVGLWTTNETYITSAEGVYHTELAQAKFDDLDTKYTEATLVDPDTMDEYLALRARVREIKEDVVANHTLTFKGVAHDLQNYKANLDAYIVNVEAIIASDGILNMSEHVAYKTEVQNDLATLVNLVTEYLSPHLYDADSLFEKCDYIENRIAVLEALMIPIDAIVADLDGSAEAEQEAIEEFVGGVLNNISEHRAKITLWKETLEKLDRYADYLKKNDEWTQWLIVTQLTEFNTTSLKQAVVLARYNDIKDYYDGITETLEGITNYAKADLMALCNDLQGCETSTQDAIEALEEVRDEENLWTNANTSPAQRANLEDALTYYQLFLNQVTTWNTTNNYSADNAGGLVFTFYGLYENFGASIDFIETNYLDGGEGLPVDWDDVDLADEEDYKAVVEALLGYMAQYRAYLQAWLRLSTAELYLNNHKGLYEYMQALVPVENFKGTLFPLEFLKTPAGRANWSVMIGKMNEVEHVISNSAFTMIGTQCTILQGCITAPVRGMLAIIDQLEELFDSSVVDEDVYPILHQAIVDAQQEADNALDTLENAHPDYDLDIAEDPLYKNFKEWYENINLWIDQVRADYRAETGEDLEDTDTNDDVTDPGLGVLDPDDFKDPTDPEGNAILDELEDLLNQFEELVLGHALGTNQRRKAAKLLFQAVCLALSPYQEATGIRTWRYLVAVCQDKPGVFSNVNLLAETDTLMISQLDMLAYLQVLQTLIFNIAKRDPNYIDRTINWGVVGRGALTTNRNERRLQGIYRCL